MLRTSPVKPLNALNHQFNGRLHSLRPKYSDYLTIDFVNGKRGIEAAHVILAHGVTLARLIHVGYELLHVALPNKGNGCTESAKLFKMSHVNTVEVGVANLGRGADHDNLPGVQTIQYFKDLAETTGLPYQTLINLYLTDCAEKKRKPEVSWIPA